MGIFNIFLFVRTKKFNLTIDPVVVNGTNRSMIWKPKWMDERIDDRMSEWEGASLKEE